MKDESEEIKKFLESIPDQFEIMEEGIDVEIQKEYLDYSHSFGEGELSDEQTIQLGNALFKPNIELEGKKKALTLLAHLGTITAFRQIEKFYKSPDNTIKQWTSLALQECKMFLEGELMDENIGFLSTGLGGTNNRLRYYFMVLPLTDAIFTETQKKIIKDEFPIVSQGLNSVVENIDVLETYVGFTVLIPMDVAIGNVIESGIAKCNELGVFVFEFYYVTNGKVPNEKEIEDIIQIVREG